jgi:D-threonate/D-erythronate kinase
VIQVLNKVLIIADDLTGANDAGVQFVKQGFETLSLLTMQEKEDNHEADVLVFNAETRSMDSVKAYQKMKAISESFSLSRFPFVYKKIDSTMRGNIGSEIDALLDRGIFDIAVVLPAYPKNGRITIGGYHLVKGCLLEDSEIARDPKSPVTESHLPTLLSSQSGRAVGHIDIREIRKRQVLERIHECIQRDERIIVFDSCLQDDLKTITNVLLESGLQAIWVGSAGLAESLSEEIKPPSIQTFNRIKDSVTQGNLPVFTIAGSVSVITKTQVQALTEQSGFQKILANPLLLLDDDRRVQEIVRLTETINDVIRKGYSPVLTTDASYHVMQELHILREAAGKSSMEVGNTIAESLGKVGASIVTSQNIAGLILTGGDIAYRTCKQIGIEALRIVDEVEEGIPLCEILGGRVNGLPVVTKAGAFGDTNSLVHAVEKIQKYNNGGYLCLLQNG